MFFWLMATPCDMIAVLMLMHCRLTVLLTCPSEYFLSPGR